MPRQVRKIWVVNYSANSDPCDINLVVTFSTERLAGQFINRLGEIYRQHATLSQTILNGESIISAMTPEDIEASFEDVLTYITRKEC